MYPLFLFYSSLSYRVFLLPTSIQVILLHWLSSFYLSLCTLSFPILFVYFPYLVFLPPHLYSTPSLLHSALSTFCTPTSIKLIFFIDSHLPIRHYIHFFSYSFRLFSLSCLSSSTPLFNTFFSSSCLLQCSYPPLLTLPFLCFLSFNPSFSSRCLPWCPYLQHPIPVLASRH